VDRYVRFGYRQNAGHSLGAKPVKRLPDDRGPHVSSRVQQRLTNVFEVVEKCGIALLEFQQEMKS
jgi:hypothetical protein